MDFFKRLLTRKPKKKKQSEKNSAKSVIHTPQSTNDLLTAQDQQAVNRLLRSSSAHFSILSETGYRSLAPITHPINTLLREPSINSTQTTNSVNTYTVTVHTRTVHSCTEFPNANGTTSLLSTPTTTPRKAHSIPPLTPGDQTRLERLRQDPSVLSLLDIFDESGLPNPKAFANTPARQRRVSTFKMLLGEPETLEDNSKEDVKESDFSWAEHVLEGARRGSPSASSLHSSLGMADDLFKDRLSHIADFNESMTSQSSEIPDSLEVELGTAEYDSMLIQPLKSACSEESLLRFLFEGGKQTNVSQEVPLSQVTPSKLSTALQTVPQAPRGPRGMGEPESTPLPRLTLHSGPRQQQTQLSPPPRRQQPPPLPPIPHDFQFKSSQPAKTNPLGYRRVPFSGLPNNTVGGSVVPSGTTDRSVSVASSIYPQIETIHQPLPPLPPLPGSVSCTNYDPLTPVLRRPLDLEGRREPKNVTVSIDENLPPGAPLRPTKSQIQKFLKGAKQNDRVTKSSTKAQESQVNNSFRDDEDDARTPKKPLMTKFFQTPEPSPSSKLSPGARRIMATTRDTPGRTPRKWNLLVDNTNTLTTALS